MDLKILDTDIFFNNSPNTGEIDCICSRCHRQISEKEKLFRQAVDSSDFFIKNEINKDKHELNKGADGYEFRLCISCINKIRDNV